MLSYRSRFVLITALMIALMSLGIYGTGYNMRKNTLEPVPAIIGWEKSGNGISVHVMGFNFSTEDGADFVDRINKMSEELQRGINPVFHEVSAKARDYSQKVQTLVSELLAKLF